MRSIVLLATVALAALLAIALAFAWYRSPSGLAPSPAPVALITPPPPESPAATPTLERVPRPPEPVDVALTKVAQHGWSIGDREAIGRHIEQLPRSDADFLCMTLGLTARDEVFDDINYRARLRRHLSRISTTAEFADLEAAFRQLDQARGRMERPPSPLR